MLQILTLLPSLIAAILLIRRSASHVMLKVFLPVIMLVPMYFHFGVGAVYIDPSSLVGLALAVLGVYAQRRVFRVTALDVCITLNAFSAFYADAHHRPFSTACYALAQTCFFSLLPYFIGRTLIEQTGMRTRAAKTIVFCLFVVAFFSLWEFRMTSNPFQNFTNLFTLTTWGRQTRWGFARAAGPYGHAITAGIVFSSGLILQFWLAASKSWKFSNLRILGIRRRPILITLACLAGLLMTQSRGPWIGCTFGVIVAAIGFAKNRKRAALISITSLIIAVSVATVVIDQYTKVDKTEDIDQQNATYRRELWDTYKPLIQEGGVWGWGAPWPVANGGFGFSKRQPSIDNEYIRMAMAQGYFGVSLFICMISLCIGRLIYNCLQFRKRDDIIFCYCMLGIIVSAAFSLTTVFLGQPMIQLLYLMLGWSESIVPSRDSELELQQVSQQVGKYQFEEVFV